MACVRILLIGLIVAASQWAAAGEIYFIETPAASPSEQSRQKARQMSDRARQQAGQAVPEAVYILDADGNLVTPAPQSPSERMRQSARDYLGPADEGAPPALRAAPLSDAERMRAKARGYATSDNASPASSRCSSATNQVGTIGEGAGAQKSENVIEKGGSAVSPHCR